MGGRDKGEAPQTGAIVLTTVTGHMVWRDVKGHRCGPTAGAVNKTAFNTRITDVRELKLMAITA